MQKLMSVSIVAALAWGCETVEPEESHDDGPTLAMRQGASSDGADGGPDISEVPEADVVQAAPRRLPPDEIWLQIAELYSEYVVERYTNLPREGFERFEEILSEFLKPFDGPPSELIDADVADQEAYDDALSAANLAPGPDRQSLKDGLIGSEATATVEINPL